MSAPVTCLGAASSSSTSFAVAGNGLEVSLWDIERTLASSGEKEESMNSKRKKELEEGETWRAKNVRPHSIVNMISELTFSYLLITYDYLNRSIISL
jgi:hypothetical protein